MEKILSLTIFAVCLSGSNSFNLPNINFALADAVKSDVKYRLIRSPKEEGTILNETSITYFQLDKKLPTKVIIHGWTTDETSVWYAPLKNAYLKKGPHNVFFIDWSKAGNKTYIVSAANSLPVGGFIGDFLLASGIALDKIHIIGHSLGSHVAGYVGKHIYTRTGKKIGRITATDPAGPIFEFPVVPESMRLNKHNAAFVDIIHTDKGHFGFEKPIGHVDYYPNGGHTQPGCPPLEEDDNCSHAKSNVYFIKSINTTDIMATQCSTWEEFLRPACSKNPKIVFGENVNVKSRGVYFLKINASIEDYL